MLKVFEPSIPNIDAIYMAKNYPGKAYILLDTIEKKDPQGVFLPSVGNLKAICDNNV